ncbi:MAG: RiPP maturation radical SAM C-methyltransferase [Thiomargarita sp.]|nr:RiPP maturation radical SAM C-methyltransferase [Thiomargarita sp.]
MDSDTTQLFSNLEWRNSKAREKLFDSFSSYQANEITLVVPPPALLDRPSLSVHLLQGCAEKEANTNVSVFYTNFPFGTWIGEMANTELCFINPKYLLNERLFASSAFEVPPLGRNSEIAFAKLWEEMFKFRKEVSITHAALLNLATEIEYWVEDIAKIIVEFGSKIVGCTTIFEQRASSVAILKAVKHLSPETITILGGPNCLGDMAKGFELLAPSIDYIFSGECETAFPEFIKQIKAGTYPKERIINGTPCLNMDDIPTPKYSEFYEQQANFIGAAQKTWLPYETSRGCWWGEKKPCTFCGLNGEFIAQRKKSPQRVFDEWEKLISDYSPKTVMHYDNIMPYSYFKEVLPVLKNKHKEITFYYEQKANIDLNRMRILKEARIDVIQPGIEAVSTSLLNRMNKGIKGYQNIAMMRYARSCGVTINWNLLYAFPGDSVADYKETLKVLPVLHHLSPPLTMDRLDFERFSPYCMEPSRYALKNMRPLKGYYDILPEQIDPVMIAYNFTCEYNCGAFDFPDVIKAMKNEVYAWRRPWIQDEDVYTPRILYVSEDIEEGGYPLLHMTKTSDNRYHLVDTRGLPDTQEAQSLNYEQASAVLLSMPLNKLSISDDIHKWSLENKVAIEMDNMHVALATAHPDLLAEFEKAKKSSTIDIMYAT